MTNSAFQFLSAFLTQIFRLFTSWHLPGTNVTPAGAIFAVLAMSLSVRFIKNLFTGEISSGSNSKGGSDEK